ncbi:MAG: RNA polymerase sigma factor [Vicinamibacterales bacterium]
MGHEASTDEEILAAIARAAPEGRRALADELFGRHYERVGRWCFRLTGNRERAADVAQNVFIKAYRHLDDFRGTARFTTWLYAIARHECFAELRRHGRQAADSDDEVLADVPTPEPDPEARALSASAGHFAHRVLLETLDETERAAFVLHYGDDLPLDAVTRALGLSNASGAKAYIVSAKRKLARAVTRITARGGRL